MIPSPDRATNSILRTDCSNGPRRDIPAMSRQRPIDISEVTENVRPVMPAEGSPLAGVVYPAGPDGPVVAGGPIGPCETLSPNPEGRQDPLEHAVQIHADPAAQHAAVGTLSPSDCYPAGPAGPNVAGGPVGPDDYLQVLEPFEHLVLDHADPAGQHAIIQDTVESLEHSVFETTLDGGLVEKISGSGHYPGQSIYGGDYLPGAFGSGGVSGKWTHGGDVESGIIGAVGS